MSRKICCHFNLWLIQQVSQKLKSAALNREAGFALPIGLMFGLVIVLVGSSLLIRSQDDRVSATVQQQADTSLNVADGGVSRVQAFLAANSLLAQFNLSDWQTASADLVSFSSTCTSRTQTITQIRTTITNFTTWQDIDPADPSKGQFRLANYTYTPNSSTSRTPGTGVIDIEARSSGQQSTNRLVVRIPVQPGSVDGIPIPGLWLAEGNTGNNEIQGNVLLNDCGTSPSSIEVTGTDPSTGQPYRAFSSNLQLPASPPRPASIPNSLPSRINNNLTLPRNSDVPTTRTLRGQTIQVYEYNVGNLDIANNRSLTITPGTRVTFYLTGSIARGGDIVHNCGNNPNCEPTNFQIFGYGPIGSSICLNGNNSIDGFILAPNYRVGIAGTGGGQGGFRGAVWTTRWSNSGSCGSNTSNRVLSQMANWNAIDVTPQNLPPRIAPASSWERNMPQ